MTTVIFHDGVMVSDGRAIGFSPFLGYDVVIREDAQKIIHIGNSIYGFAGSVIHIDRFIDYIKKGKSPPNYSYNIQVLEWDGEKLYTWKTRFNWWNLSFKYQRKVIGGKKTVKAIGSGSLYAINAFYKGKSLEECIKYVANIDRGTNSNIWKATIEKIDRLFDNISLLDHYWTSTSTISNYDGRFITDTTTTYITDTTTYITDSSNKFENKIWIDELKRFIDVKY